MATITWLANPQDNNFFNGNNWDAGRTPTSGDIAAFGASSITALTISGDTGPSSVIQFSSGAPSYSFTVTDPNATSIVGNPLANPHHVAFINEIINLSNHAQTFLATDNTEVHFDGPFGFILANGSPNGVFVTGNGINLTTDSTSSIIFGIGVAPPFPGPFGPVDSGVGASAVGTITTNGVILFRSAGDGATDAGSGARLVTNAGGVVDFRGSGGIAHAASIAGAGTYELDSGGLSIGHLNETVDLSTEVSGSIEGTGGLGYFGDTLFHGGWASTLTLSGTNTYTGGTTITTGTLQLGNGGTSGSILGNVVITNINFDATFAINRSDTYTFGGSITFGGPISAAGVFKQMGTGTTILTNTVNVVTIISAGTLQLGNGTTDGSISGGSVTDNTTLVDDDFGTNTLGGAISGSGVFQKIGTGTTILTADDGVTTTISAGTLQVGNGGTSGSISGSLTNNATLAIDRSDTVTFGGSISGTGALNQIGTGTTILTGSNSYGGGTTISAGTLQLGDGGTSGSISGALTDNGTFAIDRSDTNTFDSISGTGAFKQIGTGTTILTGSNSYGGGTTISAGTLQLGNGTADGSITGSVIDNATLADDDSGTNTLGGAISGSGAFQQIGTGTTIFTGSNSYGGGTTISAGTLQLGNGTADGSITGSVIDNATLADDDSGPNTLGGAISGSAVFQKIGTGTTILTGSNSYGGGTTISAGTLQLGNGGTTGSISGTLTDNATLAIDRSDTYTFGGSISGTGAFKQIGTGTTILTGSNSYGGGTTISAGTLQLGNGTADGSITGSVIDNATLVDDDSGTNTLGGAISGSGVFQKIGTGTTILTGSNSYGGGTTISAGTLQLGNGTADGSITGSVIDNATLVDDDSSTNTLGGTISGSGVFQQIGTGITILTGSNSYGGGTTISAGTLRLGDGGSLGSGTALTLNGGTFDLNSHNQTVGDLSGTGGTITLGSALLTAGTADSTAFAGAISGSGLLFKAGSGTLTLSGTNTYTGGTVIEAGTLRLGNGGGSGSVTGDILDNGALTIDRSDVFTFAAAIFGNGTFSQAGTGTTILTDADTVKGATDISSGTLELGSGGSIVHDVTFTGAHAILQFDTATSQLGGSILGAVAGDAVDLHFRAFAAGDHAVWQQNGATGTLSVINDQGMAATSLTLAGTFTTSNFMALTDNHGGTLIEVVPTVNSVSHIPNDFNGDGNGDILWLNSSGAVGIWEMNANGTHTDTAPGSSATAWQIMDSGDFNGDGRADMLWRNMGSGQTGVWQMNADGTTHSDFSPGVAATTSHIMGTSDFNSDGRSDILWRADDGTVSIWNMLSGAAHIDTSPGTSSTPWKIVGAGDFNGDGVSDILWRNTDGNVVIWAMNKDATTHVDLAPGASATTWHIAGVGDFNGDGRSDIMWTNDGGALGIWFMNANGTHNDASLGGSALSWHIVGTDDYNGDGKSDILWRNDSGAVGIWYMNGAGHTDAAPGGSALAWHIVDHHFETV